MSDQVLDAKGNFVQNVILTGSLNQIGASAFDGCTAMHKLWLQATQPPVFGAFSTSSMAEDYQILVPDSQEEVTAFIRHIWKHLPESSEKMKHTGSWTPFLMVQKHVRQQLFPRSRSRCPGDGSADTVEAAGTTEEQETPGVIEEVPENPQPEEIPEEEPEKPEEPEPSTDENISDGSSEETSQEQTEQSEQTEESITAVQQAESGKLTEEAKERES